MRHITAAILSTAMVFGQPALAEHERATPSNPAKAEWEVLRLDYEGHQVGWRHAIEVVATVAGPDRLRLSIGCNLLGKRPFIRAQRDVENEDRQQFRGKELDPRIVVISGREFLYTTAQGEMTWSDERGHYQGHVGPELIEALQRGDQVIFEEKSREVRVKFQLRGSYHAIEKLPCV